MTIVINYSKTSIRGILGELFQSSRYGIVHPYKAFTVMIENKFSGGWNKKSTSTYTSSLSSYSLLHQVFHSHYLISSPYQSSFSILMDTIKF